LLTEKNIFYDFMTNSNSDFIESGNPYQATFIDEKPIEMARFFRAEPTPQKITAALLKEAVHFAFMNHKLAFSVIGLVTLLIVIIPIALVLILINHYEILFHKVGFIMIFYVCLFLVVITIQIEMIEVSLKILRKESIFSSQLQRNWRQFFFVLGYRIFQVVILIFISIFAVCIIISFFGGIGLLLSYLKLIPTWGNILFFIVGYMISLVFAAVYGQRLGVSIHFIVDRKMNCIAAIRESWRFTRGNSKELQKGKRFSAISCSFFLMLLVTCGLAIVVVIGHAYCCQCVAYLMLTGQCELVVQLPDEW
jgi:hypothetical protein